MPMMFASVEGHLPSEKPLAFLGCTCQAKVPLMLGSSPADADDARFFGRGNCQARAHLMQMMLGQFDKEQPS